MLPTTLSSSASLSSSSSGNNHFIKSKKSITTSLFLIIICILLVITFYLFISYQKENFSSSSSSLSNINNILTSDDYNFSENYKEQDKEEEKCSINPTLTEGTLTREILGPKIWFLLHSFVENHDIDQEYKQLNHLNNQQNNNNKINNYNNNNKINKLTIKTQNHLKRILKYIYETAQLFPCKTCSKDFSEILRKNPFTISNMDLYEGSLSIWMCKLHNIVNKKLGKMKEWECNRKELEKMYRLKSC
ncbi:hypothetical protein ABK040_009073 [Willaertia magna]